MFLQEPESDALSTPVCGEAGRPGLQVEDLYPFADLTNDQHLCFFEEAVKLISPVESGACLE